MLDFNQAPVTRRCLRSFTEAHPGPDAVVVVENGEQPVDLESDEALQGLDVRVLRPGWNVKASTGRNLAINYLTRNSEVERIVMLDNDTTVPADFFGLAAAIQLEPLEIAAPLVFEMNSGELLYAGGAFEPGRLPRILDQWPREADEPRQVDWAPTVSLILDRETWDRVGGFEPWYGFSWEDVDWCYRATRQGARIRVVPQLRVMHEPHQSAGGPFSPERLRLWSRNGTVFLFDTAKVDKRMRLTWIRTELGRVRRELRAGWRPSALGRLRGLAQGLREVRRRRRTRAAA